MIKHLCHTSIRLILIVTILKSCDEKADKKNVENKYSNKIVLISRNAPADYSHIIKQDSLGKKINDSLGPKLTFIKNGFTYLDEMNRVKTWLPKAGTNDTLVIECYSDYLDLSTKNPFASIEETFLVKNGDTVIFNYKNNIPKAEITNREVNDIQLNYNSYRLKKLFGNKYTSHSLIHLNLLFNEDNHNYEEKSIKYYKEAQKDYQNESELLDSLLNSNTITEIDYQYRMDALNVLMEKNKRPKNIQKWLAFKRKLNNEEISARKHGFDWSKTDSLMNYSFFRNYLNYVSEYNLPFIEENNSSSGGFYIDYRIRFDSILKDKRFNQTAKNFLLTESFKKIAENFRVKDKEEYFKKLQKYTNNHALLNQLEKQHNLDFEKSDKLILTSLKKDTITYSDMLKNNKGKWLYIDFWASWCGPCKKTMPESTKIQQELKNENIEFLYLSLNDKKDNWIQAIKSNDITKSQNYFIENGMVSQIIEDLGIKTIPHYLIYNPSGKLVNGYAKRPGEGAKDQLLKYRGGNNLLNK